MAWRLCPCRSTGRAARGAGLTRPSCCARRCLKDIVRRDLLKRIRATRPQAGLSLEARQKNLDGAFKASSAVSGKSILLVDDVVTSGETAVACAKVLFAAGAL